MNDLIGREPSLWQYIMFGVEMGVSLYFYCWWSCMLTFFVKAEYILCFDEQHGNGVRVQEFLMQCTGKVSDACDLWWVSERICTFIRDAMSLIQQFIYLLELRGHFQKNSGWVSLIRIFIFSYHITLLLILYFSRAKT